MIAVNYIIPKENATISVVSVLKWRARWHCQQSSCVVHLLSEGVPSREDASASWPSSSGLRGHRIEDLPYHFRIGRLCPFINGKVCLPETSEAGARWPRRGESSREDTYLSFRWTGRLLTVLLDCLYKAKLLCINCAWQQFLWWLSKTHTSLRS
jgi:hypothetical protein